MTETHSEYRPERGHQPLGQGAVSPGLAQELRQRLEAGADTVGDWCVCRQTLLDISDDKYRALNVPSSRTTGRMVDTGRTSHYLCFDEDEPIFTGTESLAVEHAAPPHLYNTNDKAFRCDALTWRTTVAYYHDGTCAVLYEGNSLAEAEAWRRRANDLSRENQTPCVVEGTVAAP